RATRSAFPCTTLFRSSKSGPFATMGADVLSGVRFAVEEANAKGGVDGRKIVVAEADDESTPDAGRRAAEKLVRDGHKFIIGPITDRKSTRLNSSHAKS